MLPRNQLVERNRPRLSQRLRTRDGVALIVSNVVGVGIFTTPAIVARMAPHPGIVVALWILGGVLAIAGALSYGELARRHPSAGGEYVYLSRMYGPTAGFLSGWTSLIAGFSGAVAASAVGLVTYLGNYFPALASEHALWRIPVLTWNITLSPRGVTAASIIIGFALLHGFSMGLAKLTQNSLAVLITVTIAVIVVCGFGFGHGSWHNFHPASTPLNAVNCSLALIPIMFTYSGWNAAAYVSEELHDARKSVARSLFIGTTVVVVLYTALNLLYLYALPVDRMKDSVNVGDTTARALFGTGWNFVTPTLVTALLGSISAMTIAGPRVYFAMARDGAFFSLFARTNRRSGTPAAAIALQATWAVVLVCCAGLEQILMYTGFAIVLSSGVAVAGLFRTNWRQLRSDRSLRMRMIAPAVFVAASILMTADVVLQAPVTALIGGTLIAAGLPLFYFTRRSATQATEPIPADTTAVPAD